jgi:Flp pilus assembly protein TadG
MIEFALVLPFILLLVLGMLDLGKAMHYRNDMTHLANEAARFAAVNRNPGAALTPPITSLEEYIEQQATTPELRNGGASITTPIDVCIWYPDGPGSATDHKPLQVVVTSEYKWLKILGIGITQEIRGASTMRMEQLGTGAYTPQASCPT